MDRVRLKTSTLRPTNAEFLDLNRINKLVDMLRRGREIFPITMVLDEHRRGYIISGRHEAYAACHEKSEADANILKTDLDVSSCSLEIARSPSTLADSIEKCQRANEECMRNGVEMVADYLVTQPLYAQVPVHH